MITFEVQDMSCNHCVGAITRAIEAVDAEAKVTADLATHRVRVDSASADTATLAAAIEEAGYTPVAVTA
jgi:copper chaperone